MGSILSRFVEWSTRFPENPAVFLDRAYNYGELNRLCSAVCALLKSHGVRKGDRVGILIENTIYTYASVLAVLSCGACYVPLNHHNPVERNRGIMDDAAIDVLLYSEQDERAYDLSRSAPVGTECRVLNTRSRPAAVTLDSVDQAP